MTAVLAAAESIGPRRIQASRKLVRAVKPTHVERKFEPHEIIVSKTDLKGHLTYANRTFMAISDFDESELMGQPHSIIRHPDMPQDAFADMWQDIKAGRPWNGYVKNRCKNGDHYWVRACVLPRYENGAVTGFISIRSKPSAAEVGAA